MTTSPENIVHQQYSKRRISSSATSTLAASRKGDLGAAFRYEKSRPRASTLQSSSISKGHTSRASLSSSFRSSVTSSIGVGNHRISIARGSVSSLPAGPKSASSRISLERIQEQKHKEEVASVFKKEHAGHVNGQSTSSKSSSVSSSSSTLQRSGGSTRVGHQHYITEDRVADGNQPTTSTSMSSTLHQGKRTVSTHSSIPTSSSKSDMASAVSPNASNTTAPRRIHIAPLRLVNSNGTGTGGVGVPSSASGCTATLPGLSSSSSMTNTSSSVNLASSSIASTWNYGTTPASSSLPLSSSQPLYATQPSTSTNYSYRPILDGIPSSAPSSSFPMQSIYEQQQQIKYAAAAQVLPYSLSSAKIPSGYGINESMNLESTGSRRRTSDFRLMQVVHPHYTYGTRSIAPLPASPAAAAAAAAASPRLVQGDLPPYLRQGSLSHSTPASVGYAGGHHGYSSQAGGDIKIQHHRNSVGWPSTSASMDQHSSATAGMFRTPQTSYAHLPASRASPAYRFPLSHSSTSACHAPTASSSQPLPKSLLQYDSMTGSLKRKASLGLVDAISPGSTSRRRRRSSGDVTVASVGGRRDSNSNGRRGSRVEGERLPPVVRPQRPETQMDEIANNETRTRTEGLQGRELEMSIVPKVEEEDPQLLLPVEAALSVAAIKAAASQIPTQEQGVDSDIPEVEGSISNDTRASAINKDRNAFAVSDGSRTLSSGMLLGSLESKDDTIASAGLRDNTHLPTTLSASTTLPPRPLSAVLELSFEGELSSAASSSSQSGLKTHHPPGVGTEKKKSNSSPLPSSPHIIARALSLPAVPVSLAHPDVAMSTGGPAGGSGGHRQRGSPYKRTSRSVGPSSASAKSAMTKHRDSMGTSTTSNNVMHPATTASTSASTSSPASQLSPIIGLPSPTTPIEAASLQRSFELREEQRKLIEERRRAAVGGSVVPPDASAASPTMSVASPGLSLSRIPIMKQHTAGGALSGMHVEQVERPSSRLATRRGHVAQEKVANLSVSTPATTNTTSESQLPPIPLTAPLQRFSSSRSITSENTLPFPRFPVSEGNNSTPREHPSQGTSDIHQANLNTQKPTSSTAGIVPASDMQSSFRSGRRATISQTLDAQMLPSSSTQATQLFSGYATVPPSRSFAFGNSTSTTTSLPSASLPMHRHQPQRSVQLPPPVSSSSTQRHHIPPPPMQAHLRSQSAAIGHSSWPTHHHSSSSTNQHYSPPGQGRSYRQIGGQLSPPSGSAERYHPSYNQQASHATSKEIFLNMFEQIYDSIMSSNSEQQEKQAIVLRGELENHLLSIVDLKISEESESERIRRLEWENKIDNRFEGFKKTLSSELLLLEKRIDAIEKRRNKNLNPADDDVTIMDKTSRKRSAEEMEEDDSDIEEEDFSSSTTSNTNATGNNTRKGKRKFNTPPELVNLTKRVEILEAHASSSSSASSSLLSPSSSSMISPRHADTSIIATSTQSETAYTTTFRPISSLRGT